MKITPACLSSFWKVVATDTEVEDRIDRDLAAWLLALAFGATTPSSTATSRRGMPSFS